MALGIGRLGTPTRSRWVGVPVAAMCAVTMALALALLVVPRPLIPGHTVSTLLPADPRQLAAAAAAVVNVSLVRLDPIPG